VRGRHLAAAIVVVAGFAGCGADHESALRQTSDKLSEVRSGTLSLRFVIASQSSARDSDVGFDIHGRFSRAARTGELPQIDLAYTQIAGARRETARVGSDGRRAWIRIGGRAYTLPPQRTRRLRSGAGGDGGAGLDALALDRWFADPKSSDGGEVDGVSTTRITGRPRVATALQELLALGRRAGAGGGALRIGDDAGRELEAAQENASITLYTGKDDHILRRLELRASFPLKRTRDLGGTIGRLRGADVRFSLSLRGPNRPNRIKRPASLQPLSALGAGT